LTFVFFVENGGVFELMKRVLPSCAFVGEAAHLLLYSFEAIRLLGDVLEPSENNFDASQERILLF
jgi:hypothetical protein